MSLANTLLVFALIILSGFADSLGFVYASRIWEKDAVSWAAIGMAALGWSVIQQLPAGGSARAG